MMSMGFLRTVDERLYMKLPHITLYFFSRSSISPVSAPTTSPIIMLQQQRELQGS